MINREKEREGGGGRGEKKPGIQSINYNQETKYPTPSMPQSHI